MTKEDALKLQKGDPITWKKWNEQRTNHKLIQGTFIKIAKERATIETKSKEGKRISHVSIINLIAGHVADAYKIDNSSVRNTHYTPCSKCGEPTVHKSGYCKNCRSKKCIKCGEAFLPTQDHTHFCRICRYYRNNDNTKKPIFDDEYIYS